MSVKEKTKKGFRWPEDPDERDALMVRMEEQLNQGPLVELPVVELEEFNGLSKAVLLEKGLRVMTNVATPNLDLAVGETVWMHPDAHTVVAKTGRRAVGQVLAVKDVKDGMALVEGMAQERWCRISEFGEVKPGYRAEVLDDWTVIQVWPASHTTQLLERPTTRYKDVAGIDAVVAQVRNAIELPAKYPEAYKAMRMRRCGGVVLYGPPGCGKTLLAKAVAGESGLAFFSVKVSHILSKYVGESEANIRRLFEAAREHAPSLIFIDEFDALGQSRSDGENARVYTALSSQLLTEMDGLEARGDVFLMAATNRVDMVDPAFLRPGRFDVCVKIPRPDKPACAAILKMYLPDVLPAEVPMGKVRQAIVEGAFLREMPMSGALLEGLANEAKKGAILRNPSKPALSTQDAEAALAVMGRKDASL